MQKENIQISVVIPAYNEARVIASTLRDVKSYLKKKYESFEVIVVDDGSTDNTVEITHAFKDIKIKMFKKNRGKGAAVREGIFASIGDVVLFMDADNSTNISELDHFSNDIRHADIVIGSRALPESKIVVSQGRLKQATGRLGNALIKSVLNMPFKDTRCGFKMFRRSALYLFKKQKIERWGFDDEILFLAHQDGLKVVEAPVTWRNNFDSKVKPSDYIKSIFELIKIRLRYQLGKYS